MDEKSLRKLDETIPEIYFDIIARIIPGALTILIYFGDRVLQDSNFLRIIASLLFSYLIGIILDIVSDIVLNRIIFRPFFILLKIIRIELLSDSILWIKIRNLRADQILVFNKMMAEKAMLRSIILVNLVIFFYRPSLFQSDHFFLLGGVSLAVLFLCHFSLQLYVTERIRNLEGLQ